jgi:hypothetical protein
MEFAWQFSWYMDFGTQFQYDFRVCFQNPILRLYFGPILWPEANGGNSIGSNLLRINPMTTSTSIPSSNIQSLINKFETAADDNGGVNRGSVVKRGGKTFMRITTPPQTQNFLSNKMPTMRDAPRRSVREMIASLQTRIAVSLPAKPVRPASGSASRLVSAPVSTKRPMPAPIHPAVPTKIAIELLADTALARSGKTAPMNFINARTSFDAVLPGSRTKRGASQPTRTPPKPLAQVKERIIEREDNSAPPAPDPGKKIMTTNPAALAMAVRFGAIGNPLFNGVTESNMPLTGSVKDKVRTFISSLEQQVSSVPNLGSRKKA